MNTSKYSDEEIVKAFKVYVTKVIKNAAIDYVRHIKSQKYKEVLFTELTNETLLSRSDNSVFLYEKSNLINKDLIKELNMFKEILKPKDRTILELTIKKKSNQEIAKTLNLSEKTIRNRKALMKKRLKERLRRRDEYNY